MFLTSKQNRTMSLESVLYYLSYLPISPEELRAASTIIFSWEDLQRFVGDLPVHKPPNPPVLNANFTTYGLNNSNTIKILLSHVFY